MEGGRGGGRRRGDPREKTTRREEEGESRRKMVRRENRQTPGVEGGAGLILVPYSSQVVISHHLRKLHLCQRSCAGVYRTVNG